MNRNTVFGTLGVGLLLILMWMVSQQEAGSINLIESDRQSLYPIENQEIAEQTEIQMSKIASASNSFGFNLFEQINPRQLKENIVISPSSIAIALAMASNGTEGATKAEINQGLELERLDSSTINQSYQKLIKTLKTADSKVKLAIANSLWVNQKITLKANFISQTQKFYQGEVTNLDFSDPQAKNRINGWVSQNTAGKIPQIVNSVSADDALYLINAIYFKGIWSNKFDEKATRKRPFYIEPNSPQPHLMMNQTGNYRYYQSDRFQAVRLPYGEREELGMYIFLPSPTSSLAEFNQKLNLDSWQEWLGYMRSQQGNITIPRFKLEYETDLTESLSKLGIKQIFHPNRADFSAMTDTRVAVDAVKHKTYVEVNEEGTEAAAVTSIGIRITSAMPQDPPFKMNVNRPFFFAIRDDVTETILFMGNVVEP